MAYQDHILDPVKKKKGVKMPLFGLDGAISSDFIMVRWAYSDEVRAVAAKMTRELKPGPDGEAAEEGLAETLILEGIVQQVAGWSFKKKCTTKAIYEFLKERPDIADRIDITSGNTKLFFSSKGENS